MQSERVAARPYPWLAISAAKRKSKDWSKAALEQLGRIDILVCNAAVNPFYGSLTKLDDDAWDKVMINNVKSSWWLAKLVAPHMVERGSGNIQLISSIGAFRATVVLGAYGISKAAEAQLARNLALELGPKGIRVNAIAPGLVKTDFAKALWSNPVHFEECGRARPAAANRPTRRHRGCRGVSRFASRQLCHRATHRRGWRLDAGRLIRARGGFQLPRPAEASTKGRAKLGAAGRTRRRGPSAMPSRDLTRRECRAPSPGHNPHARCSANCRRP